MAWHIYFFNIKQWCTTICFIKILHLDEKLNNDIIINSSPALCTTIIRIWCHSLEPAAVFMHPVFAVIAADVAVANSCITEIAGEFALTLQEVQSCTEDYALCPKTFLHLPSTPSPPWLLSILRDSPSK